MARCMELLQRRDGPPVLHGGAHTMKARCVPKFAYGVLLSQLTAGDQVSRVLARRKALFAT